MAKTKMRNFRNSVDLVRPDGSTQHFDPGMQEVSTETYDVGKIKDADGNEKDHPLKGKSDYTHWHIEANSDSTETKEERERAEAEDRAAAAASVAPSPAPQAAKSDGGTAKAKDDGKPVPNA